MKNENLQNSSSILLGSFGTQIHNVGLEISRMPSLVLWSKLFMRSVIWINPKQMVAGALSGVGSLNMWLYGVMFAD